MEDRFSLFIEDSVWAVTQNYYGLMYKTKKAFFNNLLKKEVPEKFINETKDIWSKVDRRFMHERIKELEKMVSATNTDGHKVINPNAIFKEVFPLNKESKFKAVEKKFNDVVVHEYEQTYETVMKEYVNEKAYLSKKVELYDKEQMTVPYFFKDGRIVYHNIASYNSMLYNVNMTRSGWNRTLYDANLLENDLVYLTAHPFACPLCIDWQGRVYSISGESRKYQWQQDAIDGGIGHPNCRHQWVMYWDSSQLQEDLFNSEYWREQYEIKQKERALDLKYKEKSVDRTIYAKIGDYRKVDKIDAQKKRIKEELAKLKR